MTVHAREAAVDGGLGRGFAVAPTRPELVKATRMIIVLSLLLGLTIGLMDWLLQLILVEGIARLAR